MDPVVAQVAVAAGCPTLLLRSPILAGRPAGRLDIGLGGRRFRALALALHDSDDLLVALPGAVAQDLTLTTPTVELTAIRLLDNELPPERVAARLRLLIAGDDAATQLGDRAARHALLFLLEARDPGLRRQRLALLRTALTPPTSVEGTSDGPAAPEPR